MLRQHFFKNENNQLGKFSDKAESECAPFQVYLLFLLNWLSSTNERELRMYPFTLQ
jgi:hypothetical protein